MIIKSPKTLKLFRGAGFCEHCQPPRWCQVREVHHIRHRSRGQLDIEINLVSLGSAFECPAHVMYHQTKKLQPEDFWRIVAAREQRKGWLGEWEDVQAAVECVRKLNQRPWQSQIETAMATLNVAARELCERVLMEAGL